MRFFSLLKLLNTYQKKYFILIIVLGLLAALLDFAGIALVIPIFSLLNNSSFFDKYLIILNNNFFLEKFFFKFINLDLDQKLVFFSIFLFFFFLIKNIYLLIFHYIQNSFLFSIQKNISNRLYLISTSLSFNSLKNSNTANLLRNITTDVEMLQKNYSSVINIILEIFLITLFLILLMFYNFYLTIKIFLFFFIISFLFYNFSKKYNKYYGKLTKLNNRARIKNILEVFSAIKEIKILNKISFFYNKFNSSNLALCNVQKKQVVLQQSPKLFLETIFIFAIIYIIIFGVITHQSYQDLLLLLVIFVAITFKIIPSFNKILLAIQNLKYSSPTIKDLYEKFNLLNYQKYEKKKIKLTFKKKFNSQYLIEFKNVSFKHNGQNNFSLKKINLKIKKGKLIAVIGESGSGKSTFLDLLLGLNTPYSGSIFYNGGDIKNFIEEYHKNIGYVPQDPYIFNETIKTNIAMGLGNELDLKALNYSIRSAQLLSFFRKLGKNYDYVLNENGNNLSVGQKQRIGIARALYRDPEILILDEPTSSLDSKTAGKFYHLLNKLKSYKTIIVATHKIDNLKLYDSVYLIKNSKLNKIK
jgi:ABC-type bacteriocin/lantibiotic exporter with double-glycine peptidase domain